MAEGLTWRADLVTGLRQGLAGQCAGIRRTPCADQDAAMHLVRVCARGVYPEIVGCCRSAAQMTLLELELPAQADDNAID